MLEPARITTSLTFLDRPSNMANASLNINTSTSNSAENHKEEEIAFRVEDRRFSARTEGQQTAAPDSSKRRYPSYVEELKDRVETAEKKLAEKVQWMEDEVARVRERLARELDRKLDLEKKNIVEGFLEVADNLERALGAAQDEPESSTLLQGLNLIYNSLMSKLGQLKVEALELQGQPFDPSLSEAVGMTHVTSPEEDQTVVEVLVKGYRMGDQLLRPAKVKVGRLS